MEIEDSINHLASLSSSRLECDSRGFHSRGFQSGAVIGERNYSAPTLLEYQWREPFGQLSLFRPPAYPPASPSVCAPLRLTSAEWHNRYTAQCFPQSVRDLFTCIVAHVPHAHYFRDAFGALDDTFGIVPPLSARDMPRRVYCLIPESCRCERRRDTSPMWLHRARRILPLGIGQ